MSQEGTVEYVERNTCGDGNQIFDRSREFSDETRLLGIRVDCGGKRGLRGNIAQTWVLVLRVTRKGVAKQVRGSAVQVKSSDLLELNRCPLAESHGMSVNQKLNIERLATYHCPDASHRHKNHEMESPDIRPVCVQSTKFVESSDEALPERSRIEMNPQDPRRT